MIRTTRGRFHHGFDKECHLIFCFQLVHEILFFIPFFKLDLDDININKHKITVITVKDYGHSDIINKPWRDIMHYSRLSVGYNKRDNINKYHKFLSNVISQFINIKQNTNEIIV